MKSYSSFIKSFVLLVIIITGSYTLSAQARYKHVPRVKISDKKMENPARLPKKSLPVVLPVTTIEEETNTITKEYIVNTEITIVASVSETVVTADKKSNIKLKLKRVNRIHKNPDKHLFFRKVKENSKLMEVKEVKKTNMEKWLIAMIVLYAFGFVLLITGFIFVAVSYFYLTLYYVLIITGAVFLLAASLMLLFGLTGHWYK